MSYNMKNNNYLYFYIKLLKVIFILLIQYFLFFLLCFSIVDFDL